MIWSFILAVALALVSYFLGGYFVKVAIFTGISQLTLIIIVLAVVLWLYRRFDRGRRGRVRQIPPL
jgi:hypothetical protein